MSFIYRDGKEIKVGDKVRYLNTYLKTPSVAYSTVKGFTTKKVRLVNGRLIEPSKLTKDSE